MGKLFRGSERGVRHATLGKTTVKAGESALLFTLGGKSFVVEGPRRVGVFCTTIRFLDRHVADAHQFLRIQNRSGVVVHTRGPATVFQNPCLHESVAVKRAIKLAEREAVVVFGSGDPSDGKPSAVSRRVVVGPQLLVPEPHEWLHAFAWGGGVRPADEAGKAATVVSLRREALQVQVESAAATGEALKVDLELTYQLGGADSVALVLEHTADPIKELQAALRADARSVSKGLTVEEATRSDSPLGTLDAYAQTKALALQLGVTLHGLRCAGKVSGAGVEAEAEARRSLAAAQKRQEQFAQEAEHSTRMAQQRLAEQELALASQIRSAELTRELKRMEHDFELQIQREKQELEFQRLQKLATLGVDITAVVVAAATPPPPPAGNAAV